MVVINRRKNLLAAKTLTHRLNLIVKSLNLNIVLNIVLIKPNTEYLVQLKTKNNNSKYWNQTKQKKI